MLHKALYSVFMLILLGPGLGFDQAHAQRTQDARPVHRAKPALGQMLLEKAKQNSFLQKNLVRDILTDRCQTYFRGLGSDREWKRKAGPECISAVDDFYQILDPVLVRVADSPIATESSNPPRVVVNPVCFTKELRTLIEDIRIYYFLREIIETFGAAGIGVKDLDLFSIALKHAGSANEADRWLAILFQDVSPARTHLVWLRQAGAFPSGPSKVANAVVSELEKAIAVYSRWQNGLVYTQRPPRLYSPIDTPTERTFMNSNLYHYYVPAYLSAKLAQAGHRPEKSFFVAFMFNYLYETLDGSSPAARAVWEPASITEKPTLQDIYMGYRGALRGVGLAESGIAPLKFMKSMASHPQHAIISILQDRGIPGDSINPAGRPE